MSGQYLLVGLALLASSLDVVLASRVQADYRVLRQVRAQLRVVSRPPGHLGSASGYDVRGRRVDLQVDAPRRLVAFVLHGANVRAEAERWSSVAGEAHARGVALLGFCDGALCAEELRHGVAADFPVIAEGSLLAERALAEYDRRGEVVAADGATLAVTGTMPAPLTRAEAREVLRALSEAPS